jgi:hypothetical protein
MNFFHGDVQKKQKNCKKFMFVGPGISLAQGKI